MTVKRVAVFASGNGSNFEAILENWQRTRFQGGRVELLVCNNPEAYVLERAARWQVPAAIFKWGDYQDKDQYEQAILGTLRNYKIDFIVLAGYMRLLGPVLLQPYQGRIVNLHPSLLPAFPGKDAIGQALEYGVKVSGITIHFVDEGMDTGPIIAQRVVPVDPQDTVEELAAKILREEHRLLPQVVRWLAEGRVILQGRRVFIKEDDGC